MTVRIEEKRGKKSVVYIDGMLLGSLYPKEIYTYGLKNEGETDEKTVERVKSEVLVPRAKRYVLNLLIKGDKTETELKRKLKEKDYSDETAALAVDYAASFHYIDELRTAESFIRARMYSNSERELRYKLSEKGIGDETVDMAYEQIAEVDGEDNPELKAAVSFLKKRIKPGAEAGDISYEEKQKLMAAAFRKGFKQENIKEALNMVWEE